MASRNIVRFITYRFSIVMFGFFVLIWITVEYQTVFTKNVNVPLTLNNMYSRIIQTQTQLNNNRETLFGSKTAHAASLKSSSAYNNVLPHCVLYKSPEDVSVNVTISATDFRQHRSVITGNRAIDNYRGLTSVISYSLPNQSSLESRDYIERFGIHVLASDSIPLNRVNPDSRPPNCRNMTYDDDLPTASVIIPFYNEWPSILLRTVYSVINRSPRALLKEIVIVDDFSDLESIGDELTSYINTHFPRGLVKLIRLKQRSGLIKARMEGWRVTTADVIIIFDSHMEVNYDWLPPLLAQIKRNRQSIAMATLDYIDRINFNYMFYNNIQIRYGFNWKLGFFETFFRTSQTMNKNIAENKPGPVMVGSAFAVDSEYFAEIGAYDEGMQIWGGENLELSWRVWLCGGSLIHVPCSHVGHVARSQAYVFPGGRKKIEAYNYKRAVDVWMEDNHRRFVYNNFPGMNEMDRGSIDERLKLKARLQCKPFSWYLDNVWPELCAFDTNARVWGRLRHMVTNKCLDNNDYVFPMTNEILSLKTCNQSIASQGVSLKLTGELVMSLQCVVVKPYVMRLALTDCLEKYSRTPQVWEYRTTTSQLFHEYYSECLSRDDSENLLVVPCNASDTRQLWRFENL